MSVIEHNGHTWALDDRNPPHVIRDGEDHGVSIQGEEALWSEVVRLRQQLAGAVEALAELVRLKDGPRDDAYRAAKDAAWDAARAIVRPGGSRP